MENNIPIIFTHENGKQTVIGVARNVKLESDKEEGIVGVNFPGILQNKSISRCVEFTKDIITSCNFELGYELNTQ